MKPPVSIINHYSISHVNEDAGNKTADNDFFVYRNQEIPLQEKMFQPSRSDCFIIFLQRNGCTEIRCNLRNYVLNSNTLFVIAPGAVHQLLKEESSNLISIGFTREFINKTLTNKKHADAFGFFSSQSNPHYILTVAEADNLTRNMLLLKEAYGNNEHPFKAELLHHSFSIFMFELAATLLKYRDNRNEKFTRKEELLVGFIKLLNLYFKEQRSVQFYADGLFITSKHLTRVVKEITGKTCGELIDEMVVTEAKILLSNPLYSIAQVADLLCFSDQFFFSKFFKHHTGINPSEYRKKF